MKPKDAESQLTAIDVLLECADESAPEIVEGAGAPRVAIVGVPNSGKSRIFEQLAGIHRVSANYPYTTAELAEKDATLGGEEVVLIDSPGLTGIELCSEDEEPTRTLLQQAPPDRLILCVDSSSLSRSLVLGAQLADLEIPMVVCLNMMDEALAKGILIDHKALSRELGVPVVPACALDGRGMRELASALAAAKSPRQVPYPEWVREKLQGQTKSTSRARRVEQIMTTTHPDLAPGQSIFHMLLEAHNDWAKALTERVVTQSGLAPKRSMWERVEAVALHPAGAWLFLAATLTAVYLLVAKIGVGVLATGMDTYLVLPITEGIAALTGPGLLRDVLVGDFGLLSLGLFNAVCTVLPILGVFYLAFGFLEDVGYFPLLSLQFDRLMRFLGLSGRAVLPITLGFGCNSVATMATRCLPTGRQRFIACFLISLGIPCAVQLGVMVAILITVPVVAILGLLGIVVLLQIVVGSALSRLLPRCEHGEFMMELPPLRPPRWGNILSKTYHRLVEFFAEAVPLFIASAAVMLALHYSGLLARIRELLAPVVVKGLGLPIETADVLLMTLARREVGAVMMKEMVDKGAMDLRQVFVGLLVMTLFVPCMSNTLILGRTVGWVKTAVIFVAVTLIAIGAGVAVNGAWS